MDPIVRLEGRRIAINSSMPSSFLKSYAKNLCNQLHYSKNQVNELVSEITPLSDSSSIVRVISQRFGSSVVVS